MKKLVLYTVSLILTSNLLFSQENNCFEKHRLYSKLLQEEREYQIFFPANYDINPGKAYPVIYLLDGESFFPMLTVIQRALTSGFLTETPENIIVGILNTDRIRDFTPTKSALGRDGISKTGKAVGGGSDMFLQFLTEELRTEIDSLYRTNKQNTLLGHSYGGLFTVNTLLNHTASFDTYIAIDPSLWWDNAKLAKEASEILKNSTFDGKTLYVAVATQPRPDRDYIHFNVMNDFLEKQLPGACTNGLVYYSKRFLDENHGSIPLPGMWDAFKQIFRNK
ncbi:MAG: alpha/beta hydrolase [Paludibacteraceae bacterium]